MIGSRSGRLRQKEKLGEKKKHQAIRPLVDSLRHSPFGKDPRRRQRLLGSSKRRVRELMLQGEGIKKSGRSDPYLHETRGSESSRCSKERSPFGRKITASKRTKPEKQGARSGTASVGLERK